jgi:hypothetical protein
LITRAGQEQDLPADVDLGEPVRISAGRELAEAIART